MSHEILVVPFFGQGHLLPSIELCKQIASRNLKTTLVISSNLSSTIPSSLHQHPLIEVAELPSILAPPPPPPPPHLDRSSQLGQAFEKLVSTRSQNQDSSHLVCVVVDVMMGWTLEIFHRIGVPTIGFFTSGACSAAMEYAIWKNKVHPEDIKPGDILLLPGLPQEMALTYSDFKTRPHPPPGGGLFPAGLGGRPLDPGFGFPVQPPQLSGPPDPGFPGQPVNQSPQVMMGPPKPGGRPPWLEEFGGSIAYIFNTCDDLERPFIEYLVGQLEKPVWGVGPLLPEEYWKPNVSAIRDHEVRTNRQSNVTEDEVVAWLDSKPCGSVLYVAFGTEVGPDMEESANLGEALQASSRPFIWVIQHRSRRPEPPGLPPPQFFEGQSGSGVLEHDESHFSQDLSKRVGERGLIIHGWAPQLLILSHPSIGGFLSHCGWNSTMEAIGRGVPILAWPIRGDQFHNAKLIVKVLRLGCMICNDLSLVSKDDIINGMERILEDEDVKKRATIFGAKFRDGFSASSEQLLNEFRDFTTKISSPSI